MKDTHNIRDIAPEYAFWDVQADKLCIEENKEFIIPRVLSVTSTDNFSDNIHMLERAYEPNEIIESLKDTREPVSNEICKFVAERYNVPTFMRFQF